jgi:hypothetical protein
MKGTAIETKKKSEFSAKINFNDIPFILLVISS